MHIWPQASFRPTAQPVLPFTPPDGNEIGRRKIILLTGGESVALVYVVDDEEIIATTLAAILRGSGFEAEAFVDPLEALMAAEYRTPDLLLTDVMMPQLNGVDLGAQFKAVHPKCKVLLFSGQASTLDLMHGSWGWEQQFEVLTKPVHPKELLSAIQKLIAV